MTDVPIPPSQNSWRDRRQRSRSERLSPRGRLAGAASVLQLLALKTSGADAADGLVDDAAIEANVVEHRGPAPTLSWRLRRRSGSCCAIEGDLRSGHE